MAQFLCRFLTENNKVVEEVIQASERAELMTVLREKGYRIIKVEEQRRRMSEIEIGARRISKKALTLFCRQMATMLTSGIPMAKCFDVIGSQSDEKVFKELMVELTNDVMSGSSLSAAMEKHPDDFPEMLVEMVKIGEVTGDLDGVLLRMAEQYEKNEKINQRIKGALTYPIVVVIVAIAACVFMLIKVIPSFVDVFNSLGSDLPRLTKLLLSLSDFLVNKWYIVLLILPIAVLLLIRFFRWKPVRYFIDKMKITLRLFRIPMQKLVGSRFARAMYTLVSSGVPIVQALEYSKKNVLNLYVEEAIDKIILGIRQGKSLAAQMGETGIFPKLLVSMLAVGESSGDLEGMLAKSADYFDDETAATIEQLMTILEPIMIVIVGILIGVLVIALYSPMFEAINAMQGAM